MGFSYIIQVCLLCAWSCRAQQEACELSAQDRNTLLLGAQAAYDHYQLIDEYSKATELSYWHYIVSSVAVFVFVFSIVCCLFPELFFRSTVTPDTKYSPVASHFSDTGLEFKPCTVCNFMPGQNSRSHAIHGLNKLSARERLNY